LIQGTGYEKRPLPSLDGMGFPFDCPCLAGALVIGADSRRASAIFTGPLHDGD